MDRNLILGLPRPTFLSPHRREVVWPSAGNSVILLDKFLSAQSPFHHLSGAIAVNESVEIVGNGGDGLLDFEGAYLAVFPSIFPRTQTPPKKYQLPQVVRIVVGNKQCFTKNRLSVTVWDLSEQVGVGIGDQIIQRLQVAPECLNALVP